MADLKTPEKTSEDESDTPGMLTRILKVAAYPIAVISGYWVTKVTVHNYAYDNAKFMKGVKSISEPHRSALQAIGEEADAVIKNGGTYDLPAKVSPLFEKHTPAVAERLEKLGLGTLRKQWNFTSTYQQHQAVINGLTAAGIAIGSLLMIANSKTFSRMFSKQEKNNSEDGPSV